MFFWIKFIHLESHIVEQVVWRSSPSIMEHYFSSISFSFKVLKIFGLWRTNKERYSYKVYRMFFICVFFLFYLGSIFVSALTVSTVDEFFSEILYIALTEIVMAFKTCAGFFKFYTIKQLHQQTHSTDFKPLNAKERKIFDKSITRINRYFWLLLCSTCTVWFNLLALFSGQFKLPMFPWMLGIPYGRHLPYNFYFLAVYQTTGMFLHAFINIIHDIQVCYLLEAGSIQLMLLEERFSTTQSKQTGRHNHRKLYIKYMEHFVKITNFVKQVESVWSKAIFSQFCASGITICAISFRLSSVSLKVSLVIKLERT